MPIGSRIKGIQAQGKKIEGKEVLRVKSSGVEGFGVEFEFERGAKNTINMIGRRRDLEERRSIQAKRPFDAVVGSIFAIR